MFFNGDIEARPVVIEADVELPFRFSNVLYFAMFALEKIYNKFSFKVGFMKYFMRFTSGYAFEFVSKFNLTTTLAAFNIAGSYKVLFRGVH